MKKKCVEKLVYYLSILTVLVIAILLILEVNAVFDIFEITQAGFLLYVIYYAAALLIPLVLLSTLLAFRFKEKKSIKLLVNIGIVYAVIKIILVIISSFQLFNSGLF